MKRASGKPRSFTEVNVKIGQTFTVYGRDGQALLRMKVTRADPYKRFHKVKIAKVLARLPKDTEVFNRFWDNLGTFSITDADLKYTSFARR